MIARLLRLSLRLPGAVLLGIAGLLVLLTLQPLRLDSHERYLEARRRAMRGWSGALLRLFGVRLQVVGAPPPRPFFLVSNHLSYIDILVLAHESPARFIAKAELRSWPVVGLLCRGAGVIFVNRSSKRDVVRVGEEIRRAYREREGVILFPEGTSTRGLRVERFKPPLLALAARDCRPVHAATLFYRTPENEPPADMVVAWWGGMTFVPHFLRLLQLRRIEAHLHYHPRAVEGQDRKEMAALLQGLVASTFEPLAEESEETDGTVAATG